MKPEQLRTIRKNLNLTQSALGKLLGVSHPDRIIRGWEAGGARPPVSAIILLRLLEAGIVTKGRIRCIADQIIKDR